MILAVQVVLEITGHNIVALYPVWDAEYTYTVEPLSVTPTYESVARVDRHLHRSTIDGNIGNDPTSTLVTTWVYYRVSNIYALLDYDETTKTTWDGVDGMLEFRKGVATLMAMGALSLGAVQVSFMESKTGVLDGLVLTENDENYLLTKGSWRVDGVYTKQNVNWTFNNTSLTASRDNYIYPEYTNSKGTLWGAEDFEISGNIAVAVSPLGKTITILDITDSNNVLELSSIYNSEWNLIRGVSIYNDVAFVVGGGSPSAIHAFDISDKHNIKFIKSLVSNDFYLGQNTVVAGATLFVATYSGLVAVDIGDAENMFIKSVMSSSNFSSVQGMAYSNNHVYVSALTKFIPIDVSNPYSMTELTSFTNINMAVSSAIAIDGNTAFVVDFSKASIISINITTPSSLSLLHSFLSANLLSSRGITLIGNTAYVSGFTGISSINITNISAMSDIAIFSNYQLSSPYGIESSGNTVYCIGNLSGNFMVIDATTPSVLSKLSLVPETSVKVISVSVGYDQPSTPEGDLPIWMITTDASNLFVSQTDLRTTITDELLHTQTKTFYSDRKGACHFDLTAINDENAIVHIDFLRANNQDPECGMLVAGEGKDMGKTMSDVELTTKPYETTYDRVANFETSVYQKDVVLTANTIDEARFQECLFIVDESENSNHQGLRIAGTVDDVSYRATNNSRARIKNRISGFPLIDEQPIGLDAETYFELGVNPLWITKGSGKIGFGRTTDTTRISPDYDKLETVLEGEVVYESEGMRGSCPFTNNILQSEDISNVAYTQSGLTIGTPSLSPDGITNYQEIIEDTGTNRHTNFQVEVNTDPQASSITLSRFVKRGVGSRDATLYCAGGGFQGADRFGMTFDLTNDVERTIGVDTTGFGVLQDSSIEALNDDWSRISITGTIVGTLATTVVNALAISESTWTAGSIGDSRLGDGASSIICGGVQTTETAFLTPYALTVASPVTTAGDIIDHDSSDINIPDLTTGNWSLDWSGTPYFEAGDTNDQYIIRNYTDINNFIKLFINNNEIIFSIKSGGTQKDVIYTTAVSGTDITIKAKCESGFVSLLIDGTQVDITDFSAVLDVPIADKTYVTSAGASTPNSNSLMYTTKYAWSES